MYRKQQQLLNENENKNRCSKSTENAGTELDTIGDDGTKAHELNDARALTHTVHETTAWTE